MYISKLIINDFRAFNSEYTFDFIKGVNCLSGHNATGKSTILAILSNCGELKKEDGAQLNGKAFRGEYSQLIKGDPDKDRTGEVCKIIFDELPSSVSDNTNPFVDELQFRATFQDGSVIKRKETVIDKDKSIYEISKEKVKLSNDRYRLIPKKSKDRPTEKKLNWPVIYLGLSRLFPLGESESLKQSTIKTEYDSIISEKHREILSSNDTYTSLVNVDTDVSQKRGVGFDTEKYSYKANSSGQDNLGQILLAVYSFENLKKSYDDFCGGILIIDELDATLHPAAQHKLLDFLVDKSDELGIQIFFTTHSQTLLEYINKRNEKVSEIKKVSNHYLDNSRRNLEIRFNPTTEFIKQNLQETYSGMLRNSNLTILTEDEVGRWFLNKILDKNEFKHISRVTMPNISIGWEQLIKLIKNDFSTFKNYMIFLDPDVAKTENRKVLNDLLSGTFFKNYINKKNGNIFFVELGENVEKTFYDYLFSLEQDDPFFYDPLIEEFSLTYHSLRNGGPSSSDYEEIQTELGKIKVWFQTNKYIIDIAFNYWYEENKELLDDFYARFNTAFNRILNQI